MGTIASQSPASRLFTQSFIQTQIKENIIAPRHWPLCREFTGDRWIPRTNGQQRGKCFHLMTSSWHKRKVINLNVYRRIGSHMSAIRKRTTTKWMTSLSAAWQLNNNNNNWGLFHVAGLRIENTSRHAYLRDMNDGGKLGKKNSASLWNENGSNILYNIWYAVIY